LTTFYWLPLGGIPGQQKVALRLKAQTNRIVSSFKTNTLTCTLQTQLRFAGHKDGIWDVCASKLALGIPVIGTASADHRAGINYSTIRDEGLIF